MREGRIENSELPQEPASEIKSEVEQQPQAEMPDDFVEPKGKSGKWGEVVENKELGVRYREKVIELPKHRQEETGIKYIRRRELLPPFPEQLHVISKEDNPLLEEWEKAGMKPPRYEYPFWRTDRKPELDSMYKFLTDGIYPSSNNWIHCMNMWGDKKGMIGRHKREGLYLQEIFPDKEGDSGGESLSAFFERTSGGLRTLSYQKFMNKYPTGIISKDQIAVFDLFCSPSKMWTQSIRNPVFIFGNNNQALKAYAMSVFKSDEAVRIMNLQHDTQEDPQSNPEFIVPESPEYSEEMKKMYGEKALEKEKKNIEAGVVIPKDYPQGINGLKVLLSGASIPEVYEPRLTCIRHPDIKPLRWCHAELALVPTKRSLNVLFFETGEEDKKEE